MIADDGKYEQIKILYLAVLKRAMRDFKKLCFDYYKNRHNGVLKSKNKQEYFDLKHWFYCLEKDGKEESEFEIVCDICGIDRDRILLVLKKYEDNIKSKIYEEDKNVSKKKS